MINYTKMNFMTLRTVGNRKSKNIKSALCIEALDNKKLCQTLAIASNFYQCLQVSLYLT
jgi:hypothetical protein